MKEEAHTRQHKVILGGSIVYLLVVSALMLYHNIWFSPDQFFIFALVAAVILGRGKKFLQDWAPFLLIFLSYEFFRGALPALAKFPLHSQDLIDAELAIFGMIPTIELQKRFLNVDNFQWYDFYLSLIYMSFFIFPLVFSFIIWAKNHALFKLLTFCFFILMYSGFITYTLFPAMPPWMASERGLLPPLERILYKTTAYLTVPGALPTFYQLFRGNATAAIPSLHAALPTLLLFISLLTKKKLLIAATAIYVASMYVSIVYLGEHYVIDGLIGAFYAVVSLAVGIFLGKRLRLVHLPPSA